jgi:hypothetical protein
MMPWHAIHVAEGTTAVSLRLNVARRRVTSMLQEEEE